MLKSIILTMLVVLGQEYDYTKETGYHFLQLKNGRIIHFLSFLFS